jgi:hypothetical protein
MNFWRVSENNIQAVAFVEFVISTSPAPNECEETCEEKSAPIQAKDFSLSLEMTSD